MIYIVVRSVSLWKKLLVHIARQEKNRYSEAFNEIAGGQRCWGIKHWGITTSSVSQWIILVVVIGGRDYIRT